MRRFLGLVGGVLVAVPVVLTGLRFAHTDLSWMVQGAAFSSYALLGFVVLLVGSLVLLAGRPRPAAAGVVAVLAAVGLVVQAVVVVPLFTGGSDTDPDAGPDLTVMSANLEFGQGDPLTVVRTVRSDDVDVLVLQEVTADAVRGLTTAGLGRLLPFRSGASGESAEGTMVFSRHRLGADRGLALGSGGLDVRVLAPRPFRLLAVHTAQPVARAEQWLNDLTTLRRRAADAVRSGPTVVVGDFNATVDHAPFREVLGTGLRDAAEQAGSGWQPTWPTRNRSRWLRPLITIDHVLTSEPLTAVETRTVLVPRTDHLALVVGLEWNPM